jgi:hypothetical protein
MEAKGRVCASLCEILKMRMSATGILAMKTKISNHSITMPCNLPATQTCAYLLIQKVINSKLVVLFVTSVPYLKMLRVVEP